MDKTVKITCNKKREKFQSVKSMMRAHNQWIQFRKTQIESGKLSAPEKKKTINAIQSMKTRIKNSLEQEFHVQRLSKMQGRVSQIIGLLGEAFPQLNPQTKAKFSKLLGIP